jgi:HSP20 family molecular chaperone IbpA
LRGGPGQRRVVALQGAQCTDEASFERRIRLPEGATEADVKASYKHGILEIRVPVSKV